MIRIILFIVCITLISVFFIWIPSNSLSRGVYTDKDYVNAIIGEASNQTEKTMICVAQALRNRGTLKGVYGINARHIRNESELTWNKAWIAWDLSSRKPDTIRGYKNFGTWHDLLNKRPVNYVKCGDFLFY